MLSNRRRRHTLHVLKNAENGRVGLSEVAEQVAAWENETTREELSYDERRSVRTALQQHHAPKMEEAGLIAYDDRDQVLELTADAEAFEVYLETDRDAPPWGVYFPALTAFCTLAVATDWAGLVALPGSAWVAFVLAVFGVSSLVFLYDTRYRMRVGSGETPPEVDSTVEE
jgi:hypothetical protein